MRKIITIILFFLLGIFTAYVIYKTVFKPKYIHYHAGFQVYVDGKLQDFSAAKYMSLLACGEHGNTRVEQLQKAHLHDRNGKVVHVHSEGVYWEDLFKNIQSEFPANKQMTAYINGDKVSDILKQKIEPYDSVIILVGSYDIDKNYNAQAVTKDEILEAEKKSESCSG